MSALSATKFAANTHFLERERATAVAAMWAEAAKALQARDVLLPSTKAINAPNITIVKKCIIFRKSSKF